MTIIEPVTLDIVRAHEEATAANVRLGGYQMDRVCPTNEFQLFRVALDDSDLGRVFLLGITKFGDCTDGRSWRLLDLLPKAAALDRVAPFIADKVDLPSRVDLALLIVTPEPRTGPLTLTDGNHRAMAHYSTHKSMQGVPAFVCAHPDVRRWNYIPPLARVA